MRLTRLSVPPLGRCIAVAVASSRGSSRAEQAGSPSRAKMVWRYFGPSRLASVAKRVCGPPIAKVENTWSRCGIRSFSGMDRNPLGDEAVALGDRLPVEIALGVAAVELR